jgi:hypothetical protein
MKYGVANGRAEVDQHFTGKEAIAPRRAEFRRVDAWFRRAGAD